MAQKKTNTERIKDNAERISDNADRISELEAQVAALLGNADKPSEEPKTTKKSTAAKKPAAKKPAAKKPAAKSTTAKKPAAKKPAAKSTAAKKPAAKKPAAKKAEPKEEPVVEEEQTVAPIDEEMAKAIAEAEAFAAAQNEPKAEEPAPEQKQEPVQAEATATKEEVEEPKAEEPKAEEPAPVAAEAAAVQEPQATEKPVKSGSFVAKTDAALKSKKAKLPIFITVNSLFLISAILLMFTSFAFGTTSETYNYNIFQYYANSGIVKAYLEPQALGWTDGAYVMLGILMFLAMLVPLALMIKNIIIFVRKKDASVYNADALIYFATMLFFISMVNMFGAWLSAGQVICLIISAIILAFTLLTMLLTKSVKQLPFFSIVNIVLVFMSLFMLTWKVYDKTVGADSYAWSPAAAAHAATGGGFMFFMLLLTVIALVALVVLQMKRFPGAVGHIIEIVVPLVAAGCALVAVICAGAALPSGLDVSGAFIVGVLFTILLAVADTLFTFLKPLKKYRVLVDDSNDGHGNNVFADATPVATETVSADAAEEKPVEEKPAEEKEEEELEAIFCTECGTKNDPDCSFCTKCGTKLIKE